LRYRRKWLFVPLLAAGCLAVASVVVVSAIATDNPAPTHFDRLSNMGVPLKAVAARNLDVLRRGGGTDELRLLDEREGFVLYTAPAKHGGLCFAVGPARTGGIAVLACPSNEAAFGFPSVDFPILDMSGMAMGDEGVIYLGLVGFAADGVAQVAVIDSNGARHAAAVQRNVFARRMLPREFIETIVALDASGREIFRRELGAP
jgi:hypothetical protein